MGDNIPLIFLHHVFAKEGMDRKAPLKLRKVRDIVDANSAGKSEMFFSRAAFSASSLASNLVNGRLFLRPFIICNQKEFYSQVHTKAHYYKLTPTPK